MRPHLYTRTLLLTLLAAAIVLACGLFDPYQPEDFEPVPPPQVEEDLPTEPETPIEEEAPLPEVEPQTFSDGEDLRFLEFDIIEPESSVTITIEPDDLSILFYARSADERDFVAVFEVIAPDGETLYLFDFETEEASGPMGGLEGFIAEGEVAMFLPPAPQFALQPGEYTIEFGTEGDDFAEVGAIIKSGNANASQAIDFNVWLATDAADLQDSSFIETIQADIDAILNPHDMQVGEFYVSEAPAEVVEEFNSGGGEVTLDEDDIPTACRLAAEDLGAERAVNLVVVDWITAAGVPEGEIAGVTSGLPGTIFVPDSKQSCVIASYLAYEDSTVEHAANWLHESAHFMSLVHTTEEDGQFFDLLADTPECPADVYDEDGDGFVDDFECDLEGGADNFIFYSGVIDFAPFQMTDDQAWVLARHPLFYPVE
ncbi:MAG: hypothetical protein DWQ07_08335 [Chloroflexi bacterium]|nr:MAG: hypothetical protein DWQ07_08335 [Chloroflexota bacterium]MBL1193281.1 hypothetical protein [Chloroflexota bacterium]NOH10573.1 hypothetical protein [Chloroflexota bacterium]